MSPVIAINADRVQLTHIYSFIKLPNNVKLLINRQGIQHIEYVFEDSKDEDIISVFHTLLPNLQKQLEQPNTSILFHCMAGKSRSVGIVILMLMRCFGYSFEKCMKLFEASGRIIQPNARFLCDIKQYPGIYER